MNGSRQTGAPASARVPRANEHDAGVCRVTVSWSPAQRRVQSVNLTLPAGSSVAQALAAAGLDAAAAHRVAIWGRKARLDQTVADGDRVEWCRPLRVDPKVARRQRFQRQGVKTAGLFARRRPGSKPGY